MWKDGVNADKYAEDYKIEELKVKPGDKIQVHLAPGGGMAGVVKSF
jgi:alpha-glucosidase